MKGFTATLTAVAFGNVSRDGTNGKALAAAVMEELVHPDPIDPIEVGMVVYQARTEINKRRTDHVDDSFNPLSKRVLKRVRKQLRLRRNH